MCFQQFKKKGELFDASLFTLEMQTGGRGDHESLNIVPATII